MIVTVGNVLVLIQVPRPPLSTPIVLTIEFKMVIHFEHVVQFLLTQVLLGPHTAQIYVFG